jgi:Calpain family cysteine protease
MNNSPPDLSDEKVKPADKVVPNQPQDEPELAKVIPYWDKDKKVWMYSDIQYREIKGTAVIDDISPRDVRQGMIGDCYLMAALVSLAATNPLAIQSAITADGPGKWKVRLYAKQPDGSFKAVIYSIDNMFPTSSPGGMAYGHSNQWGRKQKSMGFTYVDNQYNDPLINPWDIPAGAAKKENFIEIEDDDNRELWPAIIEKAYAMHAPLIGMKQEGLRAAGYDDIGQGGGSHNAFEALTGKPATQADMSSLGGDMLFQKIDAALRAGAPVSAGTPGSEKKRNEKFIAGSNIYGNHAYAVMSLKGLEIELRNPWGSTYKSTDLEEHPELIAKDNSGLIKLTLEEFRAQFDAVYIGAATVPVK